MIYNPNDHREIYLELHINKVSSYTRVRIYFKRRKCVNLVFGKFNYCKNIQKNFSAANAFFMLFLESIVQKP